MLINLGPSTLHRFDHARQHEWLESNGLGGYASSTVLGTNTRRYHGLLVAALKPPVGRVVLLSKLDDSIWLQGHKYTLHTNKYQGAVNPHGYIFLQKFEQDLFPTFYYQVNGVCLKKTITAIYGQNTVIVRYEVLKAPEKFTLELQPLTMPRDYHALGHETKGLNQVVSVHNSTLYLQPFHNLSPFYISAPGMHFDYEPFWHYNFEYEEELNRGMHALEDLFTPGKMFIDLEEGQKADIVISTENIHHSKADGLLKREKVRRLALLTQAPAAHPMVQKLTLAADQFIVKRGEDLKTIIAGYHWFTDWGRDTMISLPGLCLSTGRYEDAKKILKAFALSTSMGMLPNRFPDGGEKPLYNTIDATMWYFIAVYKYALETRDYQFVLKEILPVLEDILNWHKRGTRYNIHMEKDGLLTGGTDGEMLTWMDARAGDWVVTPRIGKSVEVNALWYNAWRVFEYFLKVKGEEEKATHAGVLAQRIKQSFQEKFWYEDGKYLYDFINGEQKDTCFRPNQLFAISLPFTLIRHEQAQLILNKVEKELFTPVGIRSLSPKDPSYQGIYEGDQFARDGAYHQGTVWSWLMGPYLDALIKVRSTWGRDEAVAILGRMYQHIREAGVGHISEIFDGDDPFTARGCVAQAWGVAEILRIVHEYQLYAPEMNSLTKKVLSEKGEVPAVLVE